MSLLDHVRKIFIEEARGTVTDTRPLYAAAGILDYAVEFVRGVPTRLEAAAEQVQAEWTPERFGDAFSDLVDSASPDKVRARGQEVRERVADTLKDRRDAVVDDLADLSVDARNLPAQVRDRARQAPGRAAVEIANQVGAVFELYDTAVDRGRVAVARLRGDAAPDSAPSPANRPSGPATDTIEPVTRPRPSAVTPPITHPPVPHGPVAHPPSGDPTDHPTAGVPTGGGPTDAASASVAPTASPPTASPASASPAAAPTGVPSPSSIPSTAPLRRPRTPTRTAPGAATTPAGSPVVRRPRKAAPPPATTGPAAPPPATTGPAAQRSATTGPATPPAATGTTAPTTARRRPGGGPVTGIRPDTGIGSPPSPRRAPRSPQSPRPGPAAGPVAGGADGSTADEAASPATGTRPRTPRTTVRPPS